MQLCEKVRIVILKKSDIYNVRFASLRWITLRKTPKVVNLISMTQRERFHLINIKTVSQIQYHVQFANCTCLAFSSNVFFWPFFSPAAAEKKTRKNLISTAKVQQFSYESKMKSLPTKVKVGILYIDENLKYYGCGTVHRARQQ